jgi:hypothetical protein
MPLLEHRKGSVFAFAISLTAVFLTMVVGTMAYFESANRQANSEKWRDVAEQAARSGLDLVMGWGESHLDRESKLPTIWETNDGWVIDPVSTFGRTQADTLLTVKTTVKDALGIAGGPEGSQLGNEVAEYVLSRADNYLVTFKARIQQFRMSDDAPRQYRIGVAGRVRKIMPGDPVNVDTNEKAGIVSERLLVATIGKEPFSRYAALIDIDVVKNWVPGEIIQGPVHINRGYVDLAVSPANPFSMQANHPTFKNRRSKMLIHTTNGTGGFEAINGGTRPVFQERVSMTIMNDGAQALADDNVSDIDPADPGRRYSSALEVNDMPGPLRAPGPAAATLANVFTHPDNFGAMGGITGPVIMPSPIPFPPNSRQRIPAALGLPPGVAPAEVEWYRFKNGAARNNATLEDGLYVPTVQWVASTPIDHLDDSPAQLRYDFGDDRPAGGIYLRGNVEEMRMTVSGMVSYYMFQMGYGAPRGEIGPRRVYMVRADRTNRQITLRGFPYNITNYVNTETAPGYGAAPAAERHDSRRNPDALRLMLQRANGDPGYYFNGAGSRPLTGTSAADWAITTDLNIQTQLTAIGPNQGNFPFNGIIFVDSSSHDPLNLVTSSNGTVQAGVPITGNIFALGDKAPGNNNKLALLGSRHERVRTTAPPASAAAVPPASKLTIVAAGSIFIQNNIMLEDIRLMPGSNGGLDPDSDAVRLAISRDLLGIVADRQVVIGLAAPSAARGQTGCVVHAAVAALRDPDATSGALGNYTTGVPAYWGSFTTEGLQPLFAASALERYQVVDYRGTTSFVPLAAAPAGFFKTAHIWRPEVVYGVDNRGMPGLPIYNHNSYNGITQIANATYPNKNPRGRLVMFGSVTQFKRGAVGAGNKSYDKDFRYDKRLMSIAPPVFPASTSIGLRVTAMYAPGDQPYRPATTSANRPDLNFMGVGAANGPADVDE